MNAVVAGLPRSWQTAPSITAICCGRGEVVDARPRLIDHLQRVHPDVSFRMPLGLLRAAGERLQLREQRCDDAEIEREREADRRAWREQQLFELAPDALRRQIVERDAAAQLRGRFVEREVEARRELHRAQDAQAVVGEGVRIDHAQDPAIEIAPAVERVEVFAGQRIVRDRVDGEVAAPRRLFDRHVRIAGDDEAAMPAPGLRIAPRQRHVDVADLVDLEALADRFDAAEWIRAARAGGRPARRTLRRRCCRRSGRRRGAAGRAPSRRRSAPGRRRRVRLGAIETACSNALLIVPASARSAARIGRTTPARAR